MAGFKWVKSLDGSRDVLQRKQIDASTTVVAGSALEFSNGRLTNVGAQDDVVHYIADEGATSTATSITKINVIPAAGSMNVFEVGITPLIDDAVVVSATSTTVVVALAAGSNDDCNGGIVYVNGMQRVITDTSSYSGGNVTLTITEPWDVTPTAGDAVRAVPFGFGETAVKLGSASPEDTISVVRGDETGGKCKIIDVDLKRKAVQVLFVL